MHDNYYSENWYQATEKFFRYASRAGRLNWCVSPETPFDIPYVIIGNGAHKVVINSGIHGIEGFFGSAAQNMFLTQFAPQFSDEMLQRYSIVLIHAINGWGMQNRMREVSDASGGLVDLNRNFGIDFSKPESLPQNPKYELSHDLLLSRPDAVVKKNAIKEFRRAHLHDGAWDAISFGQYKHPYGLFYGGARAMPENKMTMHIYDKIVDADARSLISIGLHTGLGRFDRRHGRVSAQLLVSHPARHPNTCFFSDLHYATHVAADEKAVNGPVLLGDLVDCLESRYSSRGIPVYTADFEIGTGEFPIMSPIYKRMDMGDARYDLLHRGSISPQTHRNLTESWYPSDAGWRCAALERAHVLFAELFQFLHNSAMREEKVK